MQKRGGSIKNINKPHQVPPAEPEVNLLTLHHRAGGTVADIYIYIYIYCLLYTSPSPRDEKVSRMPSSA